MVFLVFNNIHIVTRFSFPFFLPQSRPPTILTTVLVFDYVFDPYSTVTVSGSFHIFLSITATEIWQPQNQHQVSICTLSSYTCSYTLSVYEQCKLSSQASIGNTSVLFVYWICYPTGFSTKSLHGDSSWLVWNKS